MCKRTPQPKSPEVHYLLSIHIVTIYRTSGAGELIISELLLLNTHVNTPQFKEWNDEGTLYPPLISIAFLLCIGILAMRSGVQFFGNFVTTNEINTQLIWRHCFPKVFMYVFLLPITRSYMFVAHFWIQGMTYWLIMSVCSCTIVFCDMESTGMRYTLIVPH